MRKHLLTIFAVICGVILLEFPWNVYAAPQAHVWYRNAQPQFQFEVAWSNYRDAPFHISCQLYANEYGVGYWELTSSLGPIVPKNKNVRVTWVGTDVSSTTIRAEKVKITYAVSGYKEMSAFMTDGTTTEAVPCGGIWISAAPKASIMNLIVKPNGTRIEY